MAGIAIATWHGSARPATDADQRLVLWLDDLWREYFPDVPRCNEIVAGYAYPWKWRLGRIRMSLVTGASEIALNGLLDHPDAPEIVLVGIIAHEIAHYAQGFGSPLPPTQRHAHAHGSVSRELARRGLAHAERAMLTWGETAWPAFWARHRSLWRPRAQNATHALALAAVRA